MGDIRSIFFVMIALTSGGPAFAAFESGKAEPLGPLLFTPEERLGIVAARSGEKKTEAPISGFGLSGLVKRAEGKGTAWINGKPVPEGQPGASSPPPVIAKDGVVLEGHRLRVGETVNTLTGDRSDIVAPGTITSGKSK